MCREKYPPRPGRKLRRRRGVVSWAEPLVMAGVLSSKARRYSSRAGVAPKTRRAPASPGKDSPGGRALLLDAVPEGFGTARRLPAQLGGARARVARRSRDDPPFHVTVVGHGSGRTTMFEFLHARKSAASEIVPIASDMADVR